MRSLRLAGLALKNMLADTPILRAAAIAIVLVPLLYGALYLWAFWDPYSRLGSMPVALVNEDRPVTVGGETLHAGDDLVEKLLDGHDVGWHLVSANQAAEGLRERRYYLSLTIPSDFSASLATAKSGSPKRAELQVVAQESSNMLASQIMSRVFAEVRASAAESASKRYIDKMFIGFSDAHQGLVEAALGATDLRGGLERAREGARALASGSSSAALGARVLATGVGALARGAIRARGGADSIAGGSAALASGLAGAHSGALRVDAGASRVASGLAQLSAGDNVLADALGRLSAGASALATSADALSEGAAALKSGLRDALTQVGTASSAAEQVQSGAGAAAAALHAYVAAHPEAASNPDIARALGGVEAVKAGSAQLAERLGTAAAGAPQLAEGASRVAGGAALLASGAHQVADGAAHGHAASTQLADGAGVLSTGARDLAGGTAKLSAGSAKATTGASALAAGAARLASGAGRLSAGASNASGGAGALAEGIRKLDGGASALAAGLRPAVEGAEKLRSGLASGAADAPDFSATLRAKNADMMSNPVGLTTSRRGEVPTYGTGFTPYFVPLALWVGALLTYFILKPLPSRALASGANPLVAALASYLPGAAFGVSQAIILMLVVQFGLGLKPVDVGATYALTIVTALAFIAILQMLNGAFGAVGKLISIVLLMLQLTSAGGTFPTQMIPGFFQAINLLLPMSYVVIGMRQTISGGDIPTAGHAALALVAFGVGALAITTFAAWRKQMFTMERLHPSLSL